MVTTDNQLTDTLPASNTPAQAPDSSDQSTTSSYLDGISPGEANSVPIGVGYGHDAPTPSQSSQLELSDPSPLGGWDSVNAITKDAWENSIFLDTARAVTSTELGLTLGPEQQKEFDDKQKAEVKEAGQMRAAVGTGGFVNFTVGALAGLADPGTYALGPIAGKLGAWLKVADTATPLVKATTKIGRTAIEATTFTAGGQLAAAISEPETGQGASEQSALANLESFGIFTGATHLFSAAWVKGGKIIRDKKNANAVTLLPRNEGLNNSARADQSLSNGQTPDVNDANSNTINKSIDTYQKQTAAAPTEAETPDAIAALNDKGQDEQIADINEKIAETKAKFDEDISSIVDNTVDPEIAANPIRSILNRKTAASLVGKTRELNDYLPETKAALEPITKSLDEINTNLGPHKAAKVEDNLPSDLENVNPSDELPALQDSAEKLQDSNPKGYAKRHAKKAEARLSGLRDNDKLADWAKKNNVDNVMDNYLSDMRDLNEHLEAVKVEQQTDRETLKVLKNGKFDDKGELLGAINNRATGKDELGIPRDPSADKAAPEVHGTYRADARDLKQAKSLVKQFELEHFLNDEDLALSEEVKQRLAEGHGDQDFLDKTVECLMGGSPTPLKKTLQQKQDEFKGGKNE